MEIDTTHYLLGGTLLILLFSFLLYWFSSSKKPSTKKQRKSKQTLPNPAYKPLPKTQPRKPPHPQCAYFLDYEEDITCMAVSRDGAYLGVGSDDRTVKVYDGLYTYLASKTIKLPLYPTKLNFSTDKKNVVIVLEQTRIVWHKHGEKKLKEFPVVHKSDIVSIAMSESPPFVMSCSSDGELKVWSLEGVVLSSISTHQMANYMGVLSSDSRLISVAAFTSDLRVWEVSFKNTGEFDKFQKVLELTGSKSGFHWVDFSADNTRLIGACKDGSWRVWRINVRHSVGEVAERLTVGQMPKDPAKWISFSPDGKKFATVSGGNLQLWDAATATVIDEIKGNHFEKAIAVAWVNGSALVSITKKRVLTWNPNALQEEEEE